MRRLSAGLLITLVSLSALSQNAKNDNTLLWKISGNGLEKPSYLFGTIHMICSEDAGLSDNMKKVISDCEEIYFEVDMDNFIEMFAALNKMKMKGDTTLKDLLSLEDYKKVKDYFSKKRIAISFRCTGNL